MDHRQPEAITDLDYRIRRAVLLLLWLCIFAAILAIGAYLKPAVRAVLDTLSPFIVAAIIAYIFNPIVRSLQIRYRLRRMTGVLYAYALILLLTGGFFAILVPLLYVQLKAVALETAANVPTLVERGQKWLRLRLDSDDSALLRIAIQQQFGIAVPAAGTRSNESATTATASVSTESESTSSTVEHIAAPPSAGTAAPAPDSPTTASLLGRAVRGLGTVAGPVAEFSRTLPGVLARVLGGIVGAIAFTAFVIVITFYFLLDYGKIEHVVRVLLPRDREDRFLAMWARIDTALGGFLRGQLTVAVIIGTLYSIALMMIGMRPYAILIGFMAGFGNLIPYLGPVIGGVPTALWVLFGDHFVGVQGKMLGLGIVVGLSVAIQTIDGFFLQPRIVGKKAELHPLLVILALLIGSQFGLGGLILAVPLAIVARVLFSEFIWQRLEAHENREKSVAVDVGSPS